MSGPARREHGWIPGPHGHALGATWYLGPHAAGPAVLLVRSFGHEDDAAGHGVAHLARTLAAAGHPALLVNLSGTGQSAGRLDAGAPERWLEEVRTVAARLAAHAPAGVVVGGHRAGALLALRALAEAGDVRPVGYLAWHLPASGRRLVRELRIMRAAQRTLETDDADAITIGAHRYPTGFVDALARLGAVPAVDPSARVLLIDPVRTSPTNPVAEALAARGATVGTVEEREEWIATGADDRVVHPDDAAFAARSFLGGFAPVPWPDRALDAFGERALPAWADDSIREEVHSFGDVDLAGVLTRPAGPSQDRTALLLLSSRGPGNAFVDLARTQAARGRAVLRYDLSGFGVNDPRHGHAPGEIYNAAGPADVAAGVGELQRQGFTNVIVIGFCAGGWAALRGRFVIPPVAVVAINVELFARNSRWMRRQVVETSTVVRWARRAGRAWRKLVTRADVAPPARRWIRRQVSSGTQVRLVYDANDPGYAHFRSRVAPPLTPALAAGAVTVKTFPALGHFTEGPDGAAMLGYVESIVDDVVAASGVEQAPPVDLA